MIFNDSFIVYGIVFETAEHEFHAVIERNLMLQLGRKFAVLDIRLGQRAFKFRIVPFIHVEADLMGILQASASGGAVVGARVVASILSIRYHGRLFLIGSMVTMITLLIFSFSSWYLVSFILLFISIFLNGNHLGSSVLGRHVACFDFCLKFIPDLM